MNHHLIVVGAGTMGAQIALQAALAGVSVCLQDIAAAQLTKARAEIGEVLERQLAKGRIDEANAEAALARLEFSTNLPDAAQAADWAIEAVVEVLSVKREVFAQLDKHLPAHAGIATNSSSIVSSRLADATNRPERCLNMHFFHPVTVMDLCEVVIGPHTADEVRQAAVDWCDRLRRTAVVIEKEVDGFVVNRILGAASREAFSLAGHGVAPPHEIDLAVRQGLRWPLGPFQLADLSGVDVVLEVRRGRLEREGNKGDEVSVQILESLVHAGRLGRKSGQGFYDYSTNPAQPLALPLECGISDGV